MLKWILLIAGSYLLGSVPFGLLMAKTHGIDLRSVGSGNIGATNLGRALGRRWAVLCFVLDALKGFAPTLAGRWVMGAENPSAGTWFAWVAVGCAAILGHIYPVYLRFRGGKGASTGMGVMLGLYPYYTFPGLITFALWIVIVLGWKYVSMASIVASASFPAVFGILIAVIPDWTFAELWPLMFVAMIMAGIVVLRHGENIRRLLTGSESKVFRRQGD